MDKKIVTSRAYSISSLDGSCEPLKLLVEFETPDPSVVEAYAPGGANGRASRKRALYDYVVYVRGT